VQSYRYPLVAFCGFARTGKDEAAKVFIDAGYNKVAFGDIIKAQLNSLIDYHFGFSAFTEVDEEKTKIRRTLQYWGEDNYENIFNEFFKKLSPPAVNGRLCRLREAESWVKLCGIIVNVTRPGVGPETEWSKNVNDLLRASGLIHSELNNCGTIEELRESVKSLYL
jgi:hypothetical protein